jgi:hypothetical protein
LSRCRQTNQVSDGGRSRFDFMNGHNLIHCVSQLRSGW